MQLVTDVFKQFCKERHEENKGKNFDTLQEIYANTEFFDLSLYPITDHDRLQDFFKSGEHTYIGEFSEPNLSLPFVNCFIKLDEDSYIFVREYAPNIITGTLYFTNYMKEMRHLAVKGTLNIPFTAHIQDEVQLVSDTYIPLLKDYMDELIRNCLSLACITLKTLNSLSKKAVVSDIHETSKVEYFRRKHAPTIKVPARPIYYVLGEKNEDIKKKYSCIQSRGKLEYTSSFHVRGHWRTINEKSLGKDRNGNYGVHGYTWVTDYIKGEGELIKRLRVVK